ncbi:MAG: M20/M25/M40 family metallo-hydrolase [bacterium]
MNDGDLVESLVRIASPTGSEAEAVAFLRSQAERDGFRVLADPVGNFVAEAGHGPRLLLFVGHVDTVPGHIPVRVEGGELWGRGSVDAKGPLVAAYCAARRHLDSSQLTIRLVGAIDEEGNSRGAKAVPTDLRPAWILIGEPSGVGAITLGYKGIVRGTLRVRRPHHHGAHPGPTAVEQAVALWQSMARDLDFADSFDSLQGHLTAMSSGHDGLYDDVTCSFNVRLPPGTQPAALEAQLSALASAAGAELVVDERVPPALADKRTPLVAAFLRTLRARGRTPRLVRKTGTADFNLFAHRHPGVPIVAYGPGDPALDHTPQERLAMADFAEAVDVLDEVFAQLAALPPSGETLSLTSRTA